MPNNIAPNQVNNASATNPPHAANVPTPGHMTNSAQSPRTYQPATTPAPLPRPVASAKPASWSSTPLASAASRSSNLNPSSYAATQNKYPSSATTYTNANYQAPQPVEVWKLQDSANASIPPDIRSQFQCDDSGHVLFFTAPPLDVKTPEDGKPPLGHSAKFLAAKLRRQELMDQKRKRDKGQQTAESERKAKAAKLQQEAEVQKEIEAARMAFARWEGEMTKEVQESYKALYGAEWERKLREVMANLS